MKEAGRGREGREKRGERLPSSRRSAPGLPPLSRSRSLRAALAAQSMLRRPPLPLLPLLPLPPRPPPARPREAASITHKAALPAAALLGARSPALTGWGLVVAVSRPSGGSQRRDPGPEGCGDAGWGGGSELFVGVKRKMGGERVELRG